MTRYCRTYLILIIVFFTVIARVWSEEALVEAPARGDNTASHIAELNAAERRVIPLDILLKASNDYGHKGPIDVTIIITNLFDKPVLLNRRMLVNQIRLPGEVSFSIQAPDGKICEIQRLVTPMSVHEDDFVILPKGQSVQRTVDLADLYPLKKKGLYKIKAIYHNELDQAAGTLHAWKGVIVSDSVDIKVD